ncbi:MAG: Fe-S cluster assembly protein SufD [Propionicimonas sp.]|uniref:Fe-S cluster assembly protein SufD n=1 Tax=Propionicimonas sp. TaxID=1955623 RepID=UPI003D119B20
MSAVPNVAEAAEAIESHLHPVASFDLADHPVPNGREEVWRFTPLRRLRGLLDGAPSGAHLTWETVLPDGVTVREISTADAVALGVPAPVDRPSALAVAQGGGAVLVEVPAGAVLADPVVIDLIGNSVDDQVYGQVVFSIGAHASATVVLRHRGSAKYASSVSVLVGEGANLAFVGLQDWADDAVHVGHVGLKIGRDAHVRTVTASLGGDLVRLVETAEYDGPGGELEQFGLYFVDAGQHIEHRLFVDHNAPHTRSRVDYRGALQGKGAHSVWVGDVLIRKVAEGINTYETNKNLVLTDGCRADSVPNLEIETGEIEGAGHSSTTGRFDDEQLFYLRSRGIPEDEARRLVVHGFFVDIIRRIGVPDVESRLLATVEKELAILVGSTADHTGAAE